MINNLSSHSAYLTVNANFMPYISQMANAGAMRFNTIAQAVEVSDGNNWIRVSGVASVGLTATAESAIAWAMKKMSEEEEIRQLAMTNVTIADALARVNQAQHELEVVKILVKENQPWHGQLTR